MLIRLMLLPLLFVSLSTHASPFYVGTIAKKGAELIAVEFTKGFAKGVGLEAGSESAKFIFEKINERHLPTSLNANDTLYRVKSGLEYTYAGNNQYAIYMSNAFLEKVKPSQTDLMMLRMILDLGGSEFSQPLVTDREMNQLKNILSLW